MREFIYKLKFLFNKQHLKTVWATFMADPNSFYDTEEITYHRLIELEHHFVQLCMQYPDYHQEYTSVLKQIRLAMKLNRIICNDGDDLYDICNAGDIRNEFQSFTSRYKCKVKVNLKNADRFVDVKTLQFYTRFPHELYLMKVKNLYYMILNNYAFNWVD